MKSLQQSEPFKGPALKSLTIKKDGKFRNRTPKKDFKGEVYQCKFCVKRFMSYPAWYVHMKLKHKNERRSKIDSDV